MYETGGVRKTIKLYDARDVHEFVRLADACDFDVNIGYDRIIIDGKSIVGVMGLDFGRELTVNYDRFSEKLGQFLDKHGCTEKKAY